MGNNKADDKKKLYKIDDLSDNEKLALKGKLKEDHRFIGDKSLDNYGPLFKAYVDADGMFYQFNQFVKDSKGSLIAAFRGNGDNITIYHNNHVVWELGMAGTAYKATFNYDHARYYCGKNGKDDETDCLKPLEELYAIGFKRSSRGKQNSFEFNKTQKKYESGTVSENAEIGDLYWKKKAGTPFEYDEIKKSYEIIMDIMDSYFNIQRAKDKFREKAGIVNESKEQVKYKPSYIEKRWQQRLFNHFKSITGERDTDLFAYDLEFSQAFPNTSIRGKIGVNEPDILAIRFENKIPKKLFLVEVKSTSQACKSDTSGALKHMEGMKRYSDEKWFMEKRFEDVWEILKQYKATGIYPELEKIDFDMFKGSLNPEEDVVRVLLLTNNELPEEEMTEDERRKGSALTFYNNKVYKNRVDAAAQQYSCKIWITESNYFDNDIVIEDVSPVN